MKTLLWIVLLLAGFGISGTVMADDVMTPDGYMGHPAFELGVNGDPSGDSFTENYGYTNYTIAGISTGNYTYNFNRVFMNVYFPVDTTLTIMGGGSYLVNGSGSGTWQTTANNFSGTENGSTTYSYSPTMSWFVSVKVYTK